jgi:hypothetical protein
MMRNLPLFMTVNTDRLTNMNNMPEGMKVMMATVMDKPAPKKISMPDDPAVLSRHIKSMAYFIGADIVGQAYANCHIGPYIVMIRSEIQSNAITNTLSV